MEPAKRRPRAARACELCRRKKNKCDELLPCTYCRNRNIECVYQNSDRTRRIGVSTEYVRQLERQIKALSAQESPSNKTALETPGVPDDDLIARPRTRIYGSTTDQNPEVGFRDETTHRRVTAKTTEVSGVNRHTNNVEFYGSSSSMALLSRVQENEHAATHLQGTEEDESSLVSQLYNPEFLPSPSDAENRLEIPQTNTMSYYQQCRTFLNNFFRTIHFIHPILDKADFLAHSDDLLFSNASSQSRSFTALCYSLLSLGALVGPRDEEASDGKGNLEWSRKFFDKARVLSGELSMTTDLEMVQCYFFMAKICQNELNPHLTYMYTGFAIRTALAIGINREPLPGSSKSFALLKAESRTWWGLYSLETEMSFAMGRPVTLGEDAYHNRHFPQIRDDDSGIVQNSKMMEPQECAIIKCMVDFARITRTICLGIYLSASPPQRNLALAFQIEKDLDSWLNNLPPNIRPSKIFDTSRNLKSVKDAQYVKKQRLVLSIRYHNMRMLLFASFLTSTTSVERASASLFSENVAKCLDSAKQTVDIIYETYRQHDFFRTWFYNTTYTLFAVSILLVYVVQEASEAEKPGLFEYVGMAIEILETMDDCFVAQKAAKMIRRALLRSKGMAAKSNDDAALPGPEVAFASDMSRSGTFNHYWGPLNFIDGDLDVNFPFELGDLEESQSLYNDFGT